MSSAPTEGLTETIVKALKVPMLKQILTTAKSLFLIGEDIKRNHDQIEVIKTQVRDLTTAVERLAYEIRRVSENEAHEREKLALRLDNEFAEV